MPGAIEDGTAGMSPRFKDMGEQVYVQAQAVKDNNKAP